MKSQLVVSIVAGLSMACSQYSPPIDRPDAEASAEPVLPHLVALKDASQEQCSNGGSLLVVYIDSNRNAFFDTDIDRVVSETKICNGSNGLGVGIETQPATLEQCPAGGSLLQTFIDTNSNGIKDVGENVNSNTTLCNGVAGHSGTSARLTSSPATSQQCRNGGVVYRSSFGDAPEEVQIVCNGESVDLAMGAVGHPVQGQDFSACHHDYLYLPDPQGGDRGWLLFRHQRNGSSGLGIGSTGFQVWNVDIENFALASEVGNVTYCRLNWDARLRILSYEVLFGGDGHQGERGEIRL